eukprot:TRINITY_DN30489_c0_g1_i1.p1 TRINITY_DN30489_c0_g1~~TRINITY_DN30489_c0_g1_i1.p1  ORF type:complete len:173 (+),score=59.70 TRINITY_DN30489_c0_g1_i1:85-603(+)
MRRGRAAAAGQRRQYRTDLEARREVQLVYWRTQEDFESLREYNDYLELIEDVVEDLVEGTPEAQAERWEAMETYRLANQPLRRAGGASGVGGGASLRPSHTTVTAGSRLRAQLPLGVMREPKTPGAWQRWCDGVHAERLAAARPVPSDEAAAGGHRALHAWRFSRALAEAPL